MLMAKSVITASRLSQHWSSLVLQR